MTPTIFHKPEMKVLGYLLRTSSNEDRGTREIPQFWQRYLSEGLRNTIPGKRYPDTELGVMVDCDHDTGDFSYLIGYEVADESHELPNGDLVYRTVPAATYAVFTTPPVVREKFAESIVGTWKAAFEDWFPTSGYEHAGTSEIELYDDRSSNPEHMQMDIYIPIKQRTTTQA